ERMAVHGLDSVGAIRLIAELGELVGRRLSPTLFWEHPTIEGLARHVAGEPAAPAGRGGASAGLDDAAPLAVIGLSCRFPGSGDPRAFWRLLIDGVCAIGEVPHERGWDELLTARGVTPEERAKVRRGGFLERIDAFDPLFFGISPREA